MLQDVEFTYAGADAPVLRGTSFSAHPGQTVAIIGSTGSGKSTLINLIPRLFDVTDGSVSVGGVDVRRADAPNFGHDWVWCPSVPSCSAARSPAICAMARPEASPEEMYALEIAQARDFVEALPDGLEATVAQGGTNFSGGQRQRLAIARAVICRPEIYLFDDSFSALDLGTDARLRAALKPITREATVIWSPSESHRSEMPTRSSYSMMGRWLDKAPTPSCCRPARPTRSSPPNSVLRRRQRFERLR
ncbi:MAG: ABC transporter ATP-binding protein [Marmoricola sp.]